MLPMPGNVQSSWDISTATSAGPVNAGGWHFDSSNWTVATSSARAGGAMPDWLLYAVVGVAVLWIIKRGKRG